MNTQEQRYREEYRDLIAKLSGNIGRIPFDIESDPASYDIYLAGRKAREGELNSINNMLKFATEDAAKFLVQRDQFKAENAQLRVYVKDCDLTYKKEISQLKAENESLKKQIAVKRCMECGNIALYPGGAKMLGDMEKLKDLVEKAKEIVKDFNYDLKCCDFNLTDDKKIKVNVQWLEEAEAVLE